MPFTTKHDWKKELPNIRSLGDQGLSIPEIAAMYGVSKQRIHQILNKYIPDWSYSHGIVARRMKQAERHRRKWGDKEDSELYRSQRQKLRAKKANALRVGRVFEIEYSDLDWPTHCPIFGLELDYFLDYRQENSPTFDRIDPSKEYVPGNVHIISYRANRIKNDATPEELRKLADYLDGLQSS